jgi:small conductance mechanosensitive channel
MRTPSGELLFVPNGEIRQVTNLSRDWARAVVDIPVPLGTDIARVTEILHSAGEAAYSDEELHRLLLDAPSVMGVESIEVDHLNIRLVARTLPGKQFEVGRQLRVQIAEALLAEGINVPNTLQAAPPTSAPS